MIQNKARQRNASKRVEAKRKEKAAAAPAPATPAKNPRAVEQEEEDDDEYGSDFGSAPPATPADTRMQSLDGFQPNASMRSTGTDYGDDEDFEEEE